LRKEVEIEPYKVEGRAFRQGRHQRKNVDSWIKSA